MAKPWEEFQKEPPPWEAFGDAPDPSVVDLSPEELEALPELTSTQTMMPADAGFWEDLKQTAINMTTMDPEEIAQMMTQREGIELRRTPEGEPLLLNQETGEMSRINAPGMSPMDALQLVGMIGAYSPAGKLATYGGKLARLATGVGGAAATEAGLQAAQEAQGGQFDTGEVALSGALGAVPEAVVSPIVNRLRPASGDVIDAVRSQKAVQAAEAAEVDQRLLDAAETLDLPVDTPPGLLTTSERFHQALSYLRQQPQSLVGDQETRALAALNQKVDDLIVDLGANDRVFVGDRIRKQVTNSLDDLKGKFENIYRQVDNSIDPSLPVELPTSRAYMNSTLEKLGGDITGLSKPEKRLYQILEQPQQPTYERLDRLRQDIGDGFKGKGPFKKVSQKNLRKVYGSLRQDQNLAVEGMADEFVLENLKIADRLFGQYSNLQNEAVMLFGKNLEKEIIPAIRRGAKALPRGEAGEFRKLMNTIPESMRPEAAGVMLDVLFDKDKGLSQGVVNAFNGLERNPTIKRELFKHLPKEAEQIFDATAETMKAYKNLTNQKGVSAEMNALIEEPNAIQKLTGYAGRITWYKTMGLMGGRLATLTERQIKNMVDRTAKAQEFITSPQFNAALRQPQSPKLMNRLKNSKPYKRWVETAGPAARATIENIGLWNWLAREEAGIAPSMEDLEDWYRDLEEQ